MGVLFPFNAKNPGLRSEDTEEVQILSQKHKSVLCTRLHYLTKQVTDKDLAIIGRETLKKVEKISSSKNFITKLAQRVKLLHQILFDSEFPKTKTTKKAITAGLLYFITPNDFLADNIPGLGYLDDAFIIRETWFKVYLDIKTYLDIKGIDESLYI